MTSWIVKYLQLLKVGGCSWKGADKAGFSGGVGGLIGAGGNPVGGVLGIAGGLDAYGELVGGN
ncbi:hypothetical protein SMU107_02661 [Streptococcus mutans R221]|nr:hypothetical protein SMU107_02661 [Streptococcus mutans R221]